MNKATVRTLREFLGLSVQNIADGAGVNPRTVQRWEAVRPPEESDIPTSVEAYLAQVLDWFQTSADAILDEIDEYEEEHGRLPKVVNLSRYINDESAARAGLEVPASCHAALQGYIMALLRADGVAVEVDWVRPEE